VHRLARYVRHNAVGFVALFIALGAGAYAAGLPKNSVKSKQIKAGAVKSAELADGAVTSEKVATGSLLGDDFAAGQLPQGPVGPQGEQGPAGTDATKLFAYVSETGALQYGRGVTGSTQIGTGIYTVSFNQDLSGCVAMANNGAGDPRGNPGSVGADRVANANSIKADDTVEVWVQSTGASYVDGAFMLAVLC
jgi:hypothetical protein